MAPPKKNQPIGIFDSGIGGLTVAKEIKRQLPNENIIYFGDTAHLPYGDKSPESIKHYGLGITDFLIQKNCKAIVIACNTASAHAYNSIKKKYAKVAPIINVIDPIVEYTANYYSNSKVGVIGTKGTINSRVYAKRIARLNKSIHVTSLATPLLAPMIEEGFFNNNISQTIINSYLSKKTFQGIDSIILGCTHYPLIKKEVKKYYSNKIEVIDSAEIVAKKLAKILREKDLLGSSDNVEYKFFVSDYTDSFEKSTKTFFKDEVHLKQVKLWA